MSTAGVCRRLSPSGGVGPRPGVGVPWLDSIERVANTLDRERGMRSGSNELCIVIGQADLTVPVCYRGFSSCAVHDRCQGAGHDEASRMVHQPLPCPGVKFVPVGFDTHLNPGSWWLVRMGGAGR